MPAPLGHVRQSGRRSGKGGGKVMGTLGIVTGVLQASVYHHPSKDLIVVVRVDDFLCSGEMKELEWLFENLAQKSKKH